MFTEKQVEQLQELLSPFKNDIFSLKHEILSLKSDIVELKLNQEKQQKTLLYIKKKLNYTANTVDVMITSFNREIVENKIRIERVEKRLRISQQ